MNTNLKCHAQNALLELTPKSEFLLPPFLLKKWQLSLPRLPAQSSGHVLQDRVEAKKGEWLPGLPSPTYDLDGSLPGDNGFDPLGLAEDPENLGGTRKPS
uniref:Uncharacterized protein n=1 Tax=Cucumis melo TaxID=3656 RepID=A0A9I9EN35_CUCME